MNENLWAPWRMAYIRDLARKTETHDGDRGPTASNFLAAYWLQPEKDREHHVVHRDEHGMLLLNRYPYANGHLLAALGEARASLLDYDPAQRAALWRLVERGMDLMERALNPQGVNVGINQGEAGGAGVPEHLHVHIVPRWSADTNFITVIGEVRVIPDALEAMAEVYRATAC
ncbi:MAG: HIT domain-containing protein [Planctomycetes bacterium]|nr:HIT domain-containing protein [Planctomycetota bacterium]